MLTISSEPSLKVTRQQTCKTAVDVQNIGVDVPNPKFGEKGQPKTFFRSSYLIWYRPNLKTVGSEPDNDPALAIAL